MTNRILTCHSSQRVIPRNMPVIPTIWNCHSIQEYMSFSLPEGVSFWWKLLTNVSFLLSFYETYSVILLCHSSMTNVSFLTDQCVIPYWPMCRSLPTNVSFRTDQCVIPMCHSVWPLSFRWSQNVPFKRCVILSSQNVILDVIPAKSEYVILVGGCVILISIY